MKSYYFGLILVFQFFSTLPIPIEVEMNKENIERSIRLFPFLGLFFGLVYASTAFILHSYSSLSNLLITFVIWLLGIVLTGGIHLDGWMDTSDAFFSYRNPEQRLEIMADPRIGAFGVIGAIVLLMAKFIFIYEVLVNPSSFTFILILFIPFLSRSLMGFFLTAIPNAKHEGLGQLFQSAKGPRTMLFYLLYFLILIFSLFLINSQLLLAFTVLWISSIFSFFFIKKKTVQWFGGTTGDVIGAATEGVELLLWLVLLILQSFGMV